MADKKTKTKEIMEITLHPVRMRVIMALAGENGLTSQQIADVLRDIPQATLYRHIARLAKAGIIRVIDERPVRGTVEKVYALQDEMAQLGDLEEFNKLSKTDHMRFFTAFVATLLDDFSRYLDASQVVDMAADGVGYHKFALYLTDEELADLAAAINRDFAAFAEQKDKTGRKMRLFSTIVVPDLSGSEKEGA